MVSLLKQGDEKAYKELAGQYQKKLFSVAYGITLDREESSEIVQEIFLKVYLSIHTFREEAKFSTWLHRIAVNQCLNWRRKWKRRLRWHHQPLKRDDAAEYSELGSVEDSPDTLYSRRETGRIFREKLKDLPQEARAVFVLKEGEGLSYDEIADILKIKRGTVSSRLFYARKKLKESLKEYVNEE